jgi:hypothetical protein
MKNSIVASLFVALVTFASQPAYPQELSIQNSGIAGDLATGSLAPTRPNIVTATSQPAIIWAAEREVGFGTPMVIQGFANLANLTYMIEALFTPAANGGNVVTLAPRLANGGRVGGMMGSFGSGPLTIDVQDGGQVAGRWDLKVTPTDAKGNPVIGFNGVDPQATTITSVWVNVDPSRMPTSNRTNIASVNVDTTSTPAIVRVSGFFRTGGLLNVYQGVQGLPTEGTLTTTESTDGQNLQFPLSWLGTNPTNRCLAVADADGTASANFCFAVPPGAVQQGQ